MSDRGALMVAVAPVGGGAFAGDSRCPGSAAPGVTALEPELEALYKYLHQHPKLAFHERRTADALPDLDSPEWAPELEPTLRSMVRAEVLMLTELLAAPPSGA